MDIDIYRQLQKHLDRQVIGFPATRSGVSPFRGHTSRNHGGTVRFGNADRCVFGMSVCDNDFKISERLRANNRRED